MLARKSRTQELARWHCSNTTPLLRWGTKWEVLPSKTLYSEAKILVMPDTAYYRNSDGETPLPKGTKTQLLARTTQCLHTRAARAYKCWDSYMGPFHPRSCTWTPQPWPTPADAAKAAQRQKIPLPAGIKARHRARTKAFARWCCNSCIGVTRHTTGLKYGAMPPPTIPHTDAATPQLKTLPSMEKKRAQYPCNEFRWA